MLARSHIHLLAVLSLAYDALFTLYLPKQVDLGHGFLSRETELGLTLYSSARPALPHSELFQQPDLLDVNTTLWMPIGSSVEHSTDFFLLTLA